MKHYSVLKSELIDGLNIKPDGIYVDATLGYAGDSKEILKRVRRGFLFAFDQDMEAINYSQNELSKISDNFKIIYSNFEHLKEKLTEEGITLVDGIIFDLGLSSPQIDEKERGFSFMKDAPLDTRMDTRNKLTAKNNVINRKKVNKRDLCKELHLVHEDYPLFCIVSRITKQKGFGLIIQNIE